MGLAGRLRPAPGRDRAEKGAPERDFEIAGLDLRVNDLVAGLVQSTDTGEEATAFLRGYRSRVDLTDAELAAVPLLADLRAMSSLVWRAGRWRCGLSTLDEVVERLDEIALRRVFAVT